MLYVVLCLAFFYLPILVTMIFSFNSSKSLTRFTGFSLRWNPAFCIKNCHISHGVDSGIRPAGPDDLDILFLKNRFFPF